MPNAACPENTSPRNSSSLTRLKIVTGQNSCARNCNASNHVQVFGKRTIRNSLPHAACMLHERQEEQQHSPRNRSKLPRSVATNTSKRVGSKRSWTSATKNRRTKSRGKNRSQATHRSMQSSTRRRRRQSIYRCRSQISQARQLVLVLPGNSPRNSKNRGITTLAISKIATKLSNDSCSLVCWPGSFCLSSAEK